jgi:predicted DNA-binding transcriptional regulator YafY
MNRIDRLSAILIQLQGKKVVKAYEIAERFNISLRTVYRDVKALQESGVPIGAEAGTGYYIVEGYHLPPVMFNREEAAALLTGEKLMEHFSDRSNRQQFSSAMQKIRAVLRGSEKDFLEVLDENIAVLKNRSPQEDEFPNRFLTDIQQALGKQQVLQMEYRSAQNSEFTKRNVEPIGIYHSNNTWYLIAWCQLRGDYRNFRTDRIRNMQVSSTSYDKSRHISLQQYLERHHSEPVPEHTFKVRFSLSMARYLGNQKYYYGLVEEKICDNNQVEYTFMNNYPLEYFARWVLMWGNDVEILSPDDLLVRMKELARELKEHYQV